MNILMFTPGNTKTRRRAAIVGAAIVLATTSYLPSSAEASSFDAQPGDVMLMCDHLLLYSDQGLVLDRDNTGEGSEIIDIQVRDGRGTILYSDTLELPLGTHSVESSGPFTTAAQLQPVSLFVTSRAGNGLPNEVLLTDLEPCDHLPSYVPTPVTRPEVVGPGSTTTAPAGPSTTAPSTPTTSTSPPPTTEGTAPSNSTVPEVPTSAPSAPEATPSSNGSGVAPAAAARPVSASARFTG